MCSRAGPGWFYFLDPGSDLEGSAIPQQNCPDQGSLMHPDTDVISHLKFVPPYAANLGNLTIAVMDSANACDGYAPTKTTNIYKGQFNQVEKLTADIETVWLLTHRPIWGVTANNPGNPVSLINKNLQHALHQSSSHALPANVKLILSGHIHRYESLTFLPPLAPNSPQRPPQLIIGNSGVKLNASLSSSDFSAYVDGQGATGNAASVFGFLDIWMDPKNNGSWRGQVINPSEAILSAVCSTADLPDSLCKLTK
ncbi:MAG: hypothetical protein GY862_19620 [Gammaproteobacteria bacterium]|nr:hypothetical protein [Gammaproteobacteria bacterium]